MTYTSAQTIRIPITPFLQTAGAQIMLFFKKKKTTIAAAADMAAKHKAVLELVANFEKLKISVLDFSKDVKSFEDDYTRSCVFPWTPEQFIQLRRDNLAKIERGEPDEPLSPQAQAGYDAFVNSFKVK